MKFSLIQPGSIEITREEGVKDSRPASSLIEHESFRVVIDTEHPREDGSRYRAAFSRLGFSPAEVQCVIFTHLHPDHFGHKDLFPNAVFVFHRDERLSFYFKNDRNMILKGSALLELTPDAIHDPEYISHDPDLTGLGNRLYLRHAPGHTPGSLIIFAFLEGLVHAWVGDTFLNAAYYEQWQPPGSSWNRNLIYEHMEYVRARADIAVPGHGKPFRIRRQR